MARDIDENSNIMDSYQMGLAVSRDGGALYVADGGNCRLRKIDLATAKVTTVAGSGRALWDQADQHPRDGIGTAADFFLPSGLALSHEGGLLFVADAFDEKIRQLDLSSGAVTTLAGNSYDGFADGVGTNAEFYLPVYLSVSSDDATLFVSDVYNSAVRALNLTSGVVRTAASRGSDATRTRCIQTDVCVRIVECPYGLAKAPDDSRLYFAEPINNRIVQMEVGSGVVTSIAGWSASIMRGGGFADGIGSSALFHEPLALAVSPDGHTLYVADTANSAIRQIELPPDATLTLPTPALPAVAWAAPAAVLVLAGLVVLARCGWRRRRKRADGLLLDTSFSVSLPRVQAWSQLERRSGRSSSRQPLHEQSGARPEGPGWASIGAAPSVSSCGSAHAPSSAPPESHKVLETSDFSTLTMLSPIGRGGFATVWIARWQGNDLAVKVLKVAHESFDAPEVAHEVAILRRLRHPCICALFGLMRFEQRPALVLEYMAGGSLSSYLFERNREADPTPFRPTPRRETSARGRPALGEAWRRLTDSMTLTSASAAAAEPLAEPRARLSDELLPPPPPHLAQMLPCDKKIGFGVQLASGLCFLHSHGILHCDVKTDNALLDVAHSSCKLADFGLASLSLKSPGHSNVVSVAGTMRYVAPEKALSLCQPLKGGGEHSVSSLVSGSRIADGRPLLELEDRVDVYAFGLLLWEIAHERRAFEGLSGAAALTAACRGERPPISLPPTRDGIGALMRDCWAQFPEERPSMSAVLERLEQGMQCTPSPARAPLVLSPAEVRARPEAPASFVPQAVSAASAEGSAEYSIEQQWHYSSNDTAKLDNAPWIAVEMGAQTGAGPSADPLVENPQRQERAGDFSHQSATASSYGSNSEIEAFNGGLNGLALASPQVLPDSMSRRVPVPTPPPTPQMQERSAALERTLQLSGLG